MRDKVPCTLFHLLSNCPTSLQVEVYCDLEGSRENRLNIPPNILATVSKPDLVLVDRTATPTSVDLVELTVPWDSGAKGARVRKELMYATLVRTNRKEKTLINCKKKTNGNEHSAYLQIDQQK